jgi:small redox-active disulfide protein 2
MLIKVLGSGSTSCKALEDRVKQVVNELSLSAEVKEVQDIEEMAAYGILRAPGLVLNGRVVSSGYVPEVEELKSFFLQTAGRAVS